MLSCLFQLILWNDLRIRHSFTSLNIDWIFIHDSSNRFEKSSSSDYYWCEKVWYTCIAQILVHPSIHRCFIPWNPFLRFEHSFPIGSWLVSVSHWWTSSARLLIETIDRLNSLSQEYRRELVYSFKCTHAHAHDRMIETSRTVHSASESSQASITTISIIRKQKWERSIIYFHDIFETSSSVKLDLHVFDGCNRNSSLRAMTIYEKD